MQKAKNESGTKEVLILSAIVLQLIVLSICVLSSPFVS
jgi:hypothetical protein